MNLTPEQDRAQLIKRLRLEWTLLGDVIRRAAEDQIVAAHKAACTAAQEYDGPRTAEELRGFILRSWNERHAIGRGE